MLTVWSVPKKRSVNAVMADLHSLNYDPILGNDMCIYLDTAEAAVYAYLALSLDRVR